MAKEIKALSWRYKRFIAMLKISALDWLYAHDNINFRHASFIVQHIQLCSPPPILPPTT